jgi:thiamine-phosphate pyrophosphorylase
VILYYITDRKQFPGSESERCRRLLEKICEAAQYGIDFVQLREKDLHARELELLAREAVRVLEDAMSDGSRPARRMTRLLVNSRIDVALVAGAHGVHLRSDDISAGEARAIWEGAVCAQARPAPVVAVSCHRPEAVRAAAGNGADFAVFAPVFEKKGVPGVGLEALRQSCRPQAGPGNVEGPGTSQIPVLALGGVTLENAGQCLQAGAQGIAAIRLFQENSIGSVVESLRRREVPPSTK